MTQNIIDPIERAISRTLLQFRNSPVFINLLYALCLEIWALQAAIVNVINKRGPAEAIGVNLDALGRIVGQNRIIFDYSAMSWFTPDIDGLNIDMAPVWVTGAATGGNYVVDDNWYRKLIEARISRNFTQYGSVPEILTVIKQALGVDVGFYWTAPMQAQLVVDEYTPYWVINMILRIADDGHSEGVTLCPFPATLNVSSVLYIPADAFSPDINSIDDHYMAVADHSIILGSIV